MRKTAMDKIPKTPELIAYYKKVSDWCKANGVPFKKLQPTGLQVNVSDIPRDKANEWIEIISKN